MEKNKEENINRQVVRDERGEEEEEEGERKNKLGIKRKPRVTGADATT